MFLLNVVETEPLVRSEPSCKDLLLGAMKYHLLPDQRSDFASKQTEQRSPDGLMPYIFAIGKFSSKVYAGLMFAMLHRANRLGFPLPTYIYTPI